MSIKEMTMHSTSSATGIRWRVVMTLAAVSAAAVAGGVPAAATAKAPVSNVVVMERPTAGDGPERAIRHLGGRVKRQLPSIDAFVASVPTKALTSLRARGDVRQVNVDRRFTVRSTEEAAPGPGASLANVRAAIGSDAIGADGTGVDVALVDTGVAPVRGIRDSLVNGPDFSADADVPGMAHLDGLGHGTHMAGIITGSNSADGFRGVASGARVINVRAADHAGETSLARLLAAIDWVATRSPKDGITPRVLVLAFGADTNGDYRSDPLAYAVEAVWRRGIAVVVAAGNGGWESAGLDSPAYDPYVIAAGASDDAGTPGLVDDTVAEFSSAGSATRKPDMLAPGTAIVSLRVPGSVFDEAFPQARIGEDYFRGSGTSQAAAVLGGATALLVASNPDASPDELKAMLKSTARPLSDTADVLQGNGVVDVPAAAAAVPGDARQSWKPARAGGQWRAGVALGVEFAVENPEAWPASRWEIGRAHV